VRDQELPINSEDVSVQLPDIASFLSPKLMQAIDQLSLRDKGMADLRQSSEGTLCPSLGPHHQETPAEFAVDADYFEVVSAEVAAAAAAAAAATRSIDSWSPPLHPLERESAVSVTAKVAAFPLAAGVADAALAAIGEPAAAAESAAPHVIAEDSTADADASGGEWLW
jgi:hypothetical protein